MICGLHEEEGQIDWWWATLHSYFYLYIKYLRVLSISTNSLVVNCFIIAQQSLSITCGGESSNHLLLSVKQQVLSSGRTAVTTITQHQQWKPTMAGTLISWQMPPLSFASADQRYPVVASIGFLFSQYGKEVETSSVYFRFCERAVHS